MDGIPKLPHFTLPFLEDSSDHRCSKEYTYFKKLRIWASTDSLLKLSNFEYLERVSYEFLKVSITNFMFSKCALVNFLKQCYLKPFRCLDITHSE